jgi:uncharacterized protein (DUF342 family)
MHNGYYRLVNTDDGFGLELIPPSEGGEDIRLQEVSEFLHVRELTYDPVALKVAASKNFTNVLPLGSGECPIEPESFVLTVSADSMEAVVRFLPPSDTGNRMTADQFLSELTSRKIIYGYHKDLINQHFDGDGFYGTNLIVSSGTHPTHGKDASIKYFFSTDNQLRPTIKEDGSVDFYDLNLVNHCKKGDVLARLTPEVPGKQGINVYGTKIKAPDVKRLSLKYNAKAKLSDDRLSLISLVDGHVTLDDDKIVVSDILMLTNVDHSTGHIQFDGDVQINGNVQSNFKVTATGSVMISGSVESAIVEAGGDITIGRGMNGKSKGSLKAEGNIVSKFLESVTAVAGKSISCGAIMYSQVQAGYEVEVSGRKGMVSGGRICAGQNITVKSLGSEMGINTIVEVGADPGVKRRYHDLQKEMAKSMKEIRDVQPILESFMARHTKGIPIPESQKQHMIKVAKAIQAKKIHVGAMNLELQDLQDAIDKESRACVLITGIAYPGVKIVIGDASMSVESKYHYCRFEKIRGDVKMTPL